MIGAVRFARPRRDPEPFASLLAVLVAAVLLVGSLFVGGCANEDAARAFDRLATSAASLEAGYAAIRDGRARESVAAIASAEELLGARLAAHRELAESARDRAKAGGP